MMPSISEAWSVIGNRKVVLSLRWIKKASVLRPLVLKADCAFTVDVFTAGNTTALEATMSWQSAEPRNSTHFAAAGLFFEPTQIESARPLNMLERLPSGPTGVGTVPVSTPL